MTKQELKSNGYKYISTQNCGQKTELWAKFTGYLDTIQYCYYLPFKDIAIAGIQTTSYLTVDMLAQLRDGMRNEFLKQDIGFDKDVIWSNQT